MIRMTSLARVAALAVLTFSLLSLGACCCCDDDQVEMEDVTESRMDGETAESWIVGYRFYCEGDDHRPRGLWRGDLVDSQEAASRLAEIHRHRWGCSLSETKIRAER